jgi:hypothetical protein
MFAGLIIYIGVVSFFALLQLYRYIFSADQHSLTSHRHDTKSLLMQVFTLSYILALIACVFATKSLLMQVFTLLYILALILTVSI